MILKGSQRGGGRQLAAHLMNDRDNDHVTLHELKGFMADDLHGALEEAHAISKGTKCNHFMFSLSLNPPKGADCSTDDLVKAADRAGEALGLSDQPRAVVIHEKRGRRHAHVVWSRIDTNEMKAVQMSFYKNKLNTLAKELYIENGWDLPDGLKENGWKNPLNFTLAEWQQAKRLDLHPKEQKQLFQEAWARSDSRAAFSNALEEHGYYLAKGDRRGFVAVDLQGEVFAIARMTGVRTRELSFKLGVPDGLPSVEEVTQQNAKLMTARMRGLLQEQRDEQGREISALEEEQRELVMAQRKEREHLQQLQDERHKRETAERQGKFRKGVRGLWDVLTGRAADLRRANEQEALEGYRRDVEQREKLFEAQLEERREIAERIDECQKQHREERRMTVGQVAFLLDLERDERIAPKAQSRSRKGLEFDF